MQAKRINKFLADITANNNRECFLEHKKEYTACRASFEEGITKLITAIAQFDPTIAHLTVKDCTYRFNRDTRFSPDKSPYKNHLGAYICMNGRKSLCGGYYIHIEKGQTLVAIGAYFLPTNILTACRNEIMGNIDEWRSRVENKEFVETYGTPNASKWGDEHSKGFGLECLKSCPKDFPRDYEYMNYLRMKDYCAWVRLPDDFFEGDKWIEEVVRIFKIGKPMMDFMNDVIADYEP